MSIVGVFIVCVLRLTREYSRFSIAEMGLVTSWMMMLHSNLVGMLILWLFNQSFKNRHTTAIISGLIMILTSHSLMLLFNELCKPNILQIERVTRNYRDFLC